MKSCGIVVEYNPFHNGHAYHAQMARELSGADVVIAVMSGNFLQRGEPAIIDKWQRTKAALANGVDLVIELPFAYAVQSADYFAQGGVKLLQALGCESLCFGTDSEQVFDYQAFGTFVVANQTLIDIEYQKIKNNGLSYPQQMTAVYRKLYPATALDFASPNHILGLSYAKENAKYPHPMMLYPLPRIESQYHDAFLTAKFASATAIRKEILNGRAAVADVVPPETLAQLANGPLVSWDAYWPLLKYQLLTSTEAELRQVYQMTEGLEYRMKAAAHAETFTDFVDAIKTKRYTWTRIQRLSAYVLNQITPSAIESVWSDSYLRVLGFNQAGRKYLNQVKKELTLPLVTRVSQKAPLAVDLRCGEVYQLGDPRIEKQDRDRSPAIIG